MSEQKYTNPADESIDACELTHSERNRFFHGKLMTARDMAAEQAYHRRLFTRHARHVTGYGVTDGLAATVERVDDGLSVSVEAGYAVDCCGRPVVVPKRAPVDIPTEDVPEGDPLGLFIEYTECVTESVPIPGSEDACERECAYNRVLETFDLRVEAIGEDGPVKPVPTVDYPAIDEIVDEEDGGGDRLAELRGRLGGLRTSRERAIDAGDEARVADLDARIEEVERELAALTEEVEGRPAGEDLDPLHPELARIAASWNPDAVPVGCGPDDAHRIYLGSFAPPSETEAVDVRFRPQVYTNDMLYAAIARHTADFTNPHGVTAAQAGALVSVKGIENPGGDVDLTSTDEHIEFTTDPAEVGEHAVGFAVPGLDAHLEDFDNPHQVTAAQTGGLQSVEGVEGDDGDLGLVSPDETVSIITGANVGDNVVGLSVTGLAALEERIDQLEVRHEEDTARLTERVIRLEHYLMERSVWMKCRTFGLLGDRFDDLQTDGRIRLLARRFLDEFEAGDRVDPGAYLEYMEESIELESQLFAELRERGIDAERLEHMEEELELGLRDSDEENVFPVARAQIEVCELLRCIEPIVID